MLIVFVLLWLDFNGVRINPSPTGLGVSLLTIAYPRCTHHIAHISRDETLLMEPTFVLYVLQLWKSLQPSIFSCRICFQRLSLHKLALCWAWDWSGRFSHLFCHPCYFISFVYVVRRQLADAFNRPSISHVFVWLPSQNCIATLVAGSLMFVPDPLRSLSSLWLHCQAFAWCIEQLGLIKTIAAQSVGAKVLTNHSR